MTTMDITTENLAIYMLHLWQQGVRPPDLQTKSRDRHPEATLEQFNAAAAHAWSVAGKEENPIKPGFEVPHEPSDDICPGCGAHMQATHHPLCKGPDDPKPSPSNDLGTLVWVPHDGPVEVFGSVEPRSRAFKFWQGSADEGWTKIHYGCGGILDDEIPF